MTNIDFRVKILFEDKIWRSCMSDFKESLYKKKSFIYQIGEEYYAIGANNIELLQNALQKGNDRQIEKYLEKITRNANFYRVDAREHYRLRDKLFKFLDQLEASDEAAFKSLQDQVFRFDELCEKYQHQV